MNFLDKLTQRKKKGNLRELKLVGPLIDFSSNDYLGLARCPQLTEMTLLEWKRNQGPLNGLGSTGSRLLTGNSSYAQDLEERIAHFHGYETGTLFNCGYMANVGLLSAIAGPANVIFFDAQVHASMRDGMRLSRAQAFPFRHNDVEHLEKRLQNSPMHCKRFICVESIYSTDGSQAPLKEIAKLADAYQAYLIVDEAHATGILGPQGRGLVAQCILTQRVLAQVVTFGKALGVHGAIVLGKADLKQTLINFATPYVYTTALPLHSLAAIKCSYDQFPLLESKRVRLQALINYFCKSIPSSSLTPIHSLPVAGNAAAKHAVQLLAKRGCDVRALLSPTVQRGSEMLRICLHAFNTFEEMAKLIEAICKK